MNKITVRFEIAGLRPKENVLNCSIVAVNIMTSMDDSTLQYNTSYNLWKQALFGDSFYTKTVKERLNDFDTLPIVNWKIKKAKLKSSYRTSSNFWRIINDASRAKVKWGY